MRMRVKLLGFLVSLLPFVESMVSPFAREAQARPRYMRVECSAIEVPFRTCPTYSVGHVTLGRQFSHTRCLRDVNWGTTGDGSTIWVKGGCRGRFLVERGRPFAKALPDPVTCTSKDWTYQHCATPTWGHYISVKKQLGKTECKHGENWGFDYKGIWVNGDCSAEFAIQ